MYLRFKKKETAIFKTISGIQFLEITVSRKSVFLLSINESPEREPILGEKLLSAYILEEF